MANDFDQFPIDDPLVKPDGKYISNSWDNSLSTFFENLIGYLSQYGVFVPQLTTSQRATIQAPQDGQFIFNTTAIELEVYYAGAWHSITAGGPIVFPITAPEGGTGIVSPPIHTLPVAQGAANFNFLGPLTNGQLLIGSTGNDPVPANITGSGGVIVTNGSGTINISAPSLALTWNVVTVPSVNMTSFNGYIANRAGLVMLVLPATSSVGDEIKIISKGAGGFIVVQGAGQQIQVGNIATTLGAGGSIQSTAVGDCLELICTIADTEWFNTALQGNPTIV